MLRNKLITYKQIKEFVTANQINSRNLHGLQPTFSDVWHVASLGRYLYSVGKNRTQHVRSPAF